MGLKRGKIRPIDEKISRAFYRDVRKLQRYCENNGYTLMIYSEANSCDICVLSFNEYEIGMKHEDCDPFTENYFLCEEEYDQYSRDED